jgi:DNA primase small subunit
VRAKRILETDFEIQILESQRQLDPPVAHNPHLQIVQQTLEKKSSALGEYFQEKCASFSNDANPSGDVWSLIQEIAADHCGHEDIEHVATETLFRLCYPRLDVGVTEHLAHLVKAPFCVHPETGRICVPIPDIESFEFEDTPTLGEVFAQINEARSADLLRPYLDFFRAFVAGLSVRREP